LAVRPLVDEFHQQNVVEIDVQREQFTRRHCRSVALIGRGQEFEFTERVK